MTPPQLIKALRARMQITQMELAGILKVQLLTIQRWERGISVPRPYNWRRLCEMAETARVEVADGVRRG